MSLAPLFHYSSIYRDDRPRARIVQHSTTSGTISDLKIGIAQMHRHGSGPEIYAAEIIRKRERQGIRVLALQLAAASVCRGFRGESRHPRCRCVNCEIVPARPPPYRLGDPCPRQE